jgi:transcriptional regulator with XRE-family HTH domain
MVQRQPMVLRGWPNEGKGRPDPTRDKFRTNLARIMAERGITQASLARTMDVSRVAVHAWIWGTCFPETSRLIKLAQALNVPVGALLENEAAVTPMPEPENSNEEALLLNAFRKLPNTARLTLLADAYELSAKAAAAQAAAAVRNEVAEKGSHSV